MTAFDHLAALAEAEGLEEHPTPFVAIDLEAMERNIAQMASAFERLPSRLCPHIKHHKSSAIARIQLAAGASGVTCATTEEVAAMMGTGTPFAVLANVVTDRARLRELARLADRGDVVVAVDSEEAAGLLSAAVEAEGTSIGALVELDIGMGRCGLRGPAEAVRLAEHVASLPGLRYRGVQAYEGHLVLVEDREERRRLARDAFAVVADVAETLEARGLDSELVTGGSTSTYDATGDLEFVTDVQAGTYLLMDTTYARYTPEFEPAAAVIGSVLTARPNGEVVVNVGSKRVSADLGMPTLAGFEAQAPKALSEEHGKYEVRGPRVPRAGDRVALVPAHTCTTMSLYGQALAVRAGKLEQVLEIDAR